MLNELTTKLQVKEKRSPHRGDEVLGNPEWKVGETHESLAKEKKVQEHVNIQEVTGVLGLSLPRTSTGGLTF